MKLIRLLSVLTLSSILMLTGCSPKRDLPIQPQKLNELTSSDDILAEMTSQLYKLPTSYSEESAVKDGCFVAASGKMKSDPSLIQNFVDAVFSSQDTALTFVNFTTDGEPILISVVYQADPNIFLAVKDSSRDRYANKLFAYVDYHFTKLSIIENDGYQSLLLEERQDTAASEEETLPLCTVNDGTIEIPESYRQQQKLDEQEEQRRILEASVTEKKKLLQAIPLESYHDFSLRSASQILSQSKGKNHAYSPVSLYMALSMLAEATGGETQTEILNLLSQPDLSACREQASSLCHALSFDNSFGTLSLADSLWLNQNASFTPTIKSVIEKYYDGETGQFDPENTEDGQKIADWISQKTNGKLTPDALPLNSEEIAVLINTIYFKDQWVHQFSPEQTVKGDFTLSDQSKVSCDFMKSTSEQLYYGEGQGFQKISKAFQNGGRMTFILPDEGSTVQEFLKDQNKLKEALLTEQAMKAVNLQLPKFDYRTSLDLNEAVKALGISRAFDPANSDFTPLTNMNSVYISQIQQQSAITVDENGCEAAAFTSIAVNTFSMPVQMPEIVIDRPFVFVIEGPAANEGELVPVIFIGIVENPLENE